MVVLMTHTVTPVCIIPVKQPFQNASNNERKRHLESHIHRISSTGIWQVRMSSVVVLPITRWRMREWP